MIGISRIVYFFFLNFLFFSSLMYAESMECESSSDKSKEEPKKEEKEESKKEEEKPKKEVEEPPKIGNFSLPESQQPSPLFGFGGNIIDKGEIQLYFFADEFTGRDKKTIDLIPSILFGVTDDFSIYFNFPYTPLLRDTGHASSGLLDFFIQLEYAFYEKKTYTYTEQGTIVGNITVPTGSSKKNPPTGFGAPSLFLGGTFNHIMIDWFFYTSHGAVLTASDHGTKFGDQFLYQFCIGKNFPSPCGWIYAWMVEADGQYNKKNRIHGDIDPNSGGNSIFITPSLWISSKEMLLQFGVSFPVNQNLFGKQNKFDYALNFNFAWSFY